MARKYRQAPDWGAGQQNAAESDFAPQVRRQVEDYLSAAEAAKRLGITVTTLYDWLGQSDYGLLQIRNQPITIDYLQGGANGQGRIRIPADEVDRILEAMRVHPQTPPPRRKPPRPQEHYPYIDVPLGLPDF